MVSILAHPCTAVTFALAVRSLARCSPMKPSNLCMSSQPLKSPKVMLRSAPQDCGATSVHQLLFSATLSIHQGREFHAPKTDDIIPKHGFASGLFGRRTRSLGSGGRGRCVADCTALP
jgi:hypothetical protein